LLAALAGQAHDRFGGLVRITNRVRRERGKLRLRQQHHSDVVRDDHARRGLVGDLCVEVVTEKTEVLDRLCALADREVHEDPGGHAGSSTRMIATGKPYHRLVPKTVNDVHFRTLVHYKATETHLRCRSSLSRNSGNRVAGSWVAHEHTPGRK